MEGVTRTRVGYTGGTKKDPIYHDLGDHTEAVQIEFDPEKVPYGELADLFWSSHDPRRRPPSRQYMAAIFYHTDDQKQSILEARDRHVSEGEGRVFTQVLPASTFYPAEEYHQKYYLQQEPSLMRMLGELYPNRQAILDSAAAARLNGYLAAHLTFDEFREALLDLDDLPPNAREKIMNGVSSLKR
ncbi:MAG: peptide-methionine (S)-S-oxide reductase [Deltaproteobacteria bacterium]|nr:peptide-methionine (S)-S-oxide reductase [Deltaproteobacteria bacterium]